MISKLQQFFNQHLGNNNDNQKPLEHRLKLASAVLMVEILHVDGKVTETEKMKIRQLIKQQFDLNENEIEALLELAHDEKHEATDYYAYTSLLNTHYSQQQKIKLVEDLWQLAYADDELDKFEEHLVRRLAELLHVPHHDFIRSKHRVSGQ